VRGLRLRSAKATPSPDADGQISSHEPEAIPDALAATDRATRLAAGVTHRLLPLSAALVGGLLLWASFPVCFQFS